MGVDLKLLIVDGNMGSNAGYSHSMVEYGRHYDLFEALNKVARTIPGFRLSGYLSRIPDGSWKDESGYGEITETPYGDPLTYVSAREFLACVASHLPDRLDSLANGCVALIRELDDDAWICLYYH